MQLLEEDQLFDGLMLSDGSIYAQGRSSHYIYTQWCKHHEFLEWIETQIPYRTKIYGPYFRHNKERNKNYEYSYIRGMPCPEFDIQRNRWYLEGKKIIPRDLQIIGRL